MGTQLKMVLALAGSSESGILGVHIPEKDTPPSKEYQQASMKKAQEKRERKNKKRLYDNYLKKRKL